MTFLQRLRWLFALLLKIPVSVFRKSTGFTIISTRQLDRLTGLESANPQLELRARHQVSENEQLRSALAYAEKKQRETIALLDVRTTELHRLENDNKRQFSELEQHKRTVAYAEKKRRETVSLLDIRTAELQEAREYLTKVDDVADSEILDAVNHLNEEIFQTAAAIADAADFWAADRQVVEIDIREATSRVRGQAWVGPGLLALLKTLRDDRENSPWIQTALQAGLSTYARRLANSWDLNVRETPTPLEEVYALIRAKEPQSVAGRWRALSRVHLKESLSDEERKASLLAGLSAVVADILLVSGAPGSQSDVLAAVRDFESDLDEILGHALRFHNLAGERVVSRDFVLFSAHPRGLFEPSEMTNSSSSQRHGKEGKATNVLCTTHVGLRMRRNIGNRGSLKEDMSVLAKCVVVLQGDANAKEMADEQPLPVSEALTPTSPTNMTPNEEMSSIGAITETFFSYPPSEA